MALLLELGELGEDHHVPQVNVRGGGIDAQLDPQRPSLGQLLIEPALGQCLLGSALEDVEVSHAQGAGIPSRGQC